MTDVRQRPDRTLIVTVIGCAAALAGLMFMQTGATNAAFAGIRTEMAEIRADMREDRAELRAAIDANSAAIAEMRAAVNANSTAIAELRTEVAELRATVTGSPVRPNSPR